MNPANVNKAAVNLAETCIGFMSSLLGQSKEVHNTHYSGSDMRSGGGGSPGEDKEENGVQGGVHGNLLPAPITRENRAWHAG